MTNCEAFKELLVARLYDELDADDARRLESHLGDCGVCREELVRLGAARELLRHAEPELPVSPRVVLLAPRPFRRPMWAFAAGFACALLVLAAGLGAGWTLRGAGESGASGQVAAGLTRADVEGLIREQEARLARRLEPAPSGAKPSSPAALEAAVTKKDLDDAFSRFEKKVDGRRAADLGYVLDAITSSELRSSARIGQTRDALRYVALANDPRISAQ